MKPENETLTKEQKRRYINQTIGASLLIVIGVYLVFGLGSILKMIRGVPLSNFDIAILFTNAAVLIGKNALMFLEQGLKDIQAIKIRAERKRKYNEKRGCSKAVNALDLGAKLK